MIIITGASSGIGKYLLNHFSRTHDVYGTYHSTLSSDKRVSQVDIKCFEQVETWRQALNIKNNDKIIVINCAGVSYNAFAHKADIDEWHNVINTNLIGTFNVIRSFLPKMRESSYGRIINISSVVAQRGVMGTSAYAASKSALWGLAKSIATENAAKGITINNINLGYCDIGMGVTQVTEAQKVDLMTQIPAKRFGTAEDVARTIEYIIAAEYLNGTSIDLNGGLV